METLLQPFQFAFHQPLFGRLVGDLCFLLLACQLIFQRGLRFFCHALLLK